MRGRPKKEDSRNKQYRVRLNDDEENMLNYASEVTGQQKSEIFRQSLIEYYNKVRLNEYVPLKEDDWTMDHISLQRIIECPYCGTGNAIDFEDFSEPWSEERQMGQEITYDFDLLNYRCSLCGKTFRISGYICEYPIGAYNSEDIKIEESEEY